MIDHFHKSFMLILRRAVLRNINNILQIFGALAFMAQFRAVRRGLIDKWWVLYREFALSYQRKVGLIEVGHLNKLASLTSVV